MRGWDLHPRPHIHREGSVRRDDERVALQLGDLVVSLHQQLDAGGGHRLNEEAGRAVAGRPDAGRHGVGSACDGARPAEPERDSAHLAAVQSPSATPFSAMGRRQRPASAAAQRARLGLTGSAAAW